ncbi:hypothetical protein EHQ81_06935 [Leptospira selangorensis]|uniref:Uncharacterized protein n=1 Tax=Leptospira selangorensis TaxID=2484982 RepID=A0A5F2C058_9LEPT|nr:hypothetical protein [Leptospira selangorensis]TGM16111.1 hypothetical protein EHQ81_06935 [Leptospira selangorensis]TGM17938.1 hypothetical protein EHQ82_12770 [Leptospira selangorensis]
MPEMENNSTPPASNPLSEEGVIPVDRVDLIPEEELRNLLLQTTPKAMRDLDLIEKGVENFFLFNYSPFALAKFEQLQFLKPADLKYFEDKNGFVLYQYLFVSEETKELGLANVAIRPASRRADQIQKIKSACLAQSAAAFLQFIVRRDINLADRRSAGELRDWVIRQYLNTDEKGNLLDFQDSRNLPYSMRNVKTLSVESFLQRNFKIREDILTSLISLLSKKPNEIVAFLSQIKAVPDALLALEKRGSRSPLLRLHLEFHVIQPSLEELVGEISVDTKKPNANEETELEIIFELFIGLSRKILISLLPGEQAGWIKASGTEQGVDYLRELSKHPAFTSGKTWEGSDIFLQAFDILLSSMSSLSSLRKESLINLAFSDIVIRIRESKEPLVVDAGALKIKDSSIQAAGLTKTEVLSQVLERFKTRNDILTREKVTGAGPGIVALALENVVSSFLTNKERRTSIHTLIRKNGQPKGIYAFLKDVTEGVDSELVIDDQIRLSKAIADWEKETEKQRLKAIQDSKSILVKLLEWLLGLFGVNISPSPKKDIEPADEFQSSKQTKKSQTSGPSAEPEKEAPKKKKSLGVLMGPKEKSTLIPAKVQKAIDYVDRKNNGIIWLDEVVNASSSPEFGKDKVADLMYYDQKRRYIEIRSMNSIRHVFIRKELESDSAWLDSTLEYLENVTAKKPEFAALADTLRKFRDE